MCGQTKTGARAFQRKLVGGKWTLRETAREGQKAFAKIGRQWPVSEVIRAWLSLALPTELCVRGRCWQTRDAPWCSANCYCCLMSQSDIKCLLHYGSICKRAAEGAYWKAEGLSLDRAFHILSSPPHLFALNV